jgi:hypothetical protein
LDYFLLIDHKNLSQGGKMKNFIIKPISTILIIIFYSGIPFSISGCGSKFISKDVKPVAEVLGNGWQCFLTPTSAVSQKSFP